MRCFVLKIALPAAKDTNSTKLYIENSSARAACLFLEHRLGFIWDLSSARGCEA